MRVRAHRLPWILAVLAAASVFVGSPRAQAEPGARTDPARVRAREKGEEGLGLFGAEKYSEAYERFRVADELFHAPTLVLYMARCRRNAGRLLEAARHYDQLLAERERPDAAAAFVEAKAEAKRELEVLGLRIPTLTVRVLGASDAGLTATLDGAPVTLAELRGRAVDPGVHTITIAAGDGRTRTRKVQLAEGSESPITIDLGAPSAAAPDPPAAIDPPPPEPAAAPGGSFVPAGVAFGVGALGLGIGLATGAVSLAKVSDVKQRCEGTLCLRADGANADSARALATASTVGFVVAGLGVATGAVLLVVRRRTGVTQPPPAVEASIGPASLLLRGVF